MPESPHFFFAKSHEEFEGWKSAPKGMKGRPTNEQVNKIVDETRSLAVGQVVAKLKGMGLRRSNGLPYEPVHIHNLRAGRKKLLPSPTLQVEITPAPIAAEE